MRDKWHGTLPALLALTTILLLTGMASGEVVEHPGGFWKCRPANHLKGAFDSEDPVGLAAHAHVPTSCEVHWSDGHGTTYCFATPPSLLEFKDNPDILEKARAFWRLSH